MEYKVVQLAVSLDPLKMTSESVAEHLEQLINHYAAQGWNYIRLEDARAYVQPTGGCFGFWQTPGFTIHRQMVVFSR